MAASTQVWEAEWNSLSPYCGFVHSTEEIAKIKISFEVHSSLSFVVGKKDAIFGTGADIRPESKVWFSDKRGVVPNLGLPFVIISRLEHDCIFGRDKHKSEKLKKQATREAQLQEDHPVPVPMRRKIQASKKKNCPAKIIVLEVLTFPDFKIPETQTASIAQQKKASRLVRQSLKFNKDSVRSERRFYISLPDPAKHGDVHPVSQVYELHPPKNAEIWDGYKVGQQEDCHEFLIKVLEQIYEGLRCQNEASEVFKGTLERTVTCCTCESESKTTDNYSTLSLSMKAVDRLDDAMTNYFATEMIDTYRCRRCKKNSTALKASKISTLPKNLIITLNRFTQNGMKIPNPLKIPLILKVREHVVSSKILEDKLRLYGFVRHFGTQLGQGHYIGYVEIGMKWFRIDDIAITEIRGDISRELEQAYVLFYKRLPRPYVD